MNEQTISRIAAQGLEALRRWIRVARGPRSLAAAAATLALAATIVLLYARGERGNLQKHHELLAHLRELKAIDARQDVDAWRRQAEFPPPAAGANYAAEFTRARNELAKAAREINSAVLARDYPDFDRALDEKLDLAARARRASDASREAMQRLAGADAEMAGLVRGAWPDFAERERLVALENMVMQILAETQKYYAAPNEAQRANADALLADLRDAAPRFPPALKAGIGRLDKNVQDLLRARLDEKMLSEKLAVHPAGPRIDALVRALDEELTQILLKRSLYHVYLSAVAAALLVVLAYLLACFIIDYRSTEQAARTPDAENESARQGAEAPAGESPPPG